jgi:hypothetical protein
MISVTVRIAGVALLCVAPLLGACLSFGGGKLEHDQVDYARALDRAQKRQTLSNIVALRYADTPSFLPVTSVIAAYSFDASGSGLFSTGTAPGIGTNSQLGGTFGYSNHPTFTFTPTSGEEFAQGYIRPLAPAQVLPLVQSGVPIDLLLRIVAQSIGELRNSAALAGPGNAGDAGFFELIHTLRRLQLNGALTVRFQHDDSGNRVFLDLDAEHSGDAAVTRDAAQARQLLHVAPQTQEIEFVYGTVRKGGATVGIVTRSVIGLLTEIGAQIEVPESEVTNRATLPTVRLLEVESRPTIIVHVAADAPDDAFAAVRYGRNAYWIAPNDFDSKFAFSVVQNLIALAETGQNSKAPLVTIPAY